MLDIKTKIKPNELNSDFMITNLKEEKMFFSEQENKEIIAKFLREVKLINIENEIQKNRLSILNRIIEFIYKNPKEWDKRCSFSIDDIGNDFLSDLKKINNSELSIIDAIFFSAYQFLCEFVFWVGSSKRTSFDLDDKEMFIKLENLKEEVKNDLEKMSENERSKIIFANNYMPAEIIKKLVNDNNFVSFIDFERTIHNAKRLKEQWDEEIKDKEKVTISLKETLDKYKTAFNFVGLSEGFANLAGQKKKEGTVLNWVLIIMGFIILAPLAFEFAITFSKVFDGKSFNKIDYLVSLVPLLSIEVILIYFFRVILFNHRAVKAQQMQIELRETLCQFIQEYAKYSAKIKADNKITLDKFESLIFSGILSNPDKLPSTFDGLDQLGNLFKNIKTP